MDIQVYLDKMKKIQNYFLDYLDDEENNQEKIKDLVKLFNSQKILDNKHILTSVINLFTSIIDYHYQGINFYDKIFNVIFLFKKELKKYYDNFEIYELFKNNKRILLFLLNEKIIYFDKSIILQMYNDDLNHTKVISKFGEYFFPEIKQYLNENTYKHIKIPENIEELREIEYNDNYVLQLIQRDNINEFISYTNKKNIKLDSEIYTTFLETNLFLIQSYPLTLIEYSAFFGSVQIFKYLITNDCIIEQYLLIYAIHGRNPEIIHIIEDHNIEIDTMTYKECLKMAIKCHHNELVDYILSNYVNNEDFSTYIFKKSLKSYNFDLIENELINSNSFYYLCKYDHYILANQILQTNEDIDINMTMLSEYSDDESNTKKVKTILYNAVKKCNLDMVKLLFNHKDIDINKKSIIIEDENKNECTPLYAAIIRGNVKLVECLLNHKNIDINNKSIIYKEHQTPLFTSINCENIEIIRLLIERNDIDINLKSIEFNIDIDEMTYEYHSNVTPLYQAINNKNIEIVKLLLDHKDIDINIIISIKVEYYYLAKELIFEPFIIKETALSNAVSSNQTKMVKLLLSQANIDVNSIPKIQILHRAISNKNFEIVKLLLENKNIDVNKKIIESRKPDANIWNDKENELMKISMRSNIKNGSIFTVYCQYLYEKNPLYLAVESNNYKIVQLLLSHENIDINAKSLIKIYEYSYNEYHNNEEIEIKKVTEMAPLYLAVEQENKEIVQLLICHKNIDINMKSISYSWNYKGYIIEEKQLHECTKISEENKNETALHKAVAKGNIEIIKSLLRHRNIDINAIDQLMRKPIELSNEKDIMILFK